jgi:hypothetical protein
MKLTKRAIDAIVPDPRRNITFGTTKCVVSCSG